jgi:hypothetical protein
MWVVIGVMLKKVGMQNCILPSINQIVSNAKKYSETVVVTGAIDVGYDAIDPDA